MIFIGMGVNISWEFLFWERLAWGIPLVAAKQNQDFQCYPVPKWKFPGIFYSGTGQLDPAPKWKFPGNFYSGAKKK